MSKITMLKTAAAEVSSRRTMPPAGKDRSLPITNQGIRDKAVPGPLLMPNGSAANHLS